MVEQTDAGKCHGHAILVAGLYHVVITDRTAWLRDILHTALVSTLDVVAKWEECIRAQGYILHLV